MSDKPIEVENAIASLEKQIANNPDVLSVGTGQTAPNEYVLYIFLNVDQSLFKFPDSWQGYPVRVRGKIVAV